MALLEVVLISAAAAWLCPGAASVDPMIQNFRGFLREVLQQAAADGNWTDVVGALPDAEEVLGRGYGGWVTLRSGQLQDLDKWSRDGDCLVSQQGEVVSASARVVFDDLRYTYDFVTDDLVFSTAVGQMHGKVTALTAQVVIQANISDASQVTAGLTSFRLLPTQEVTVEEISQQNVTDVAAFSPYIDHSLVGFITDAALPAVRGDLEDVLKATVADHSFQLSSESTDTTNSSAPTSTSGVSTLTTPASSSTGNSSPDTTTTTDKITPGSTSTTTGKITPSSTTITGEITPGSTTTTTGKITPGSTTTTGEITPGSTTTTGEITPGSTTTTDKITPGSTTTTGEITPGSTTTTTGKSTPGSTATTGARRMKGNDARTAGTTSSPRERWLTDNFNGMFDLLLTSAGMELASRNMTPYSMPEGQREMFQKVDGSVRLAAGQVAGLGSLNSDDYELSVELRGDSATFTASMVFNNVTFRFDFAAENDSSPLASGAVRGNVTGLRGQVSFLANQTADMSVFNYTFQDLRLLPSADVEAVVDSNQTLAASREAQIAHAALSDVTKNLVPRLERALTAAVREAASAGRFPAPSPGGGTSSAPAVTSSAAMLAVLGCRVLQWALAGP